MNNTTGTAAGGTGWSCGSCGAWVNYGSSHSCMPFAPFPTPWPLTPWPLTHGWKCPNCHSAHAPSVLTCPGPRPMTMT